MSFDKSPEKIQTMFNIIANRYDFLNNLMSLSTQRYIKYKSIKNLNIKPHDKIIDLCCGTGDLSIIIKQIEPQADVTGIDFSDKMLEVAKQKSQNIQYLQGDVTALPYPDNTFDCAGFMHLDFGKKNLISKVFDITIPVLTKLFTENYSAYTYLIKSKQIFPEPEDLIKDFESKGFRLKKRQDFLFGVISMQVMVK